VKILFSGFYAVLLILLINVGYNKFKGEKEHTTLQEIKNDFFISDYTKSYLAFDSKYIALTSVKIIDGTGNPPVSNQTVLIRDGHIFKVGHKDSLTNMEKYQIHSLDGHTIIPGIVGTHNHMRLPQGAMLYTSPKLYLACGVTTIQTCGTGDTIRYWADKGVQWFTDRRAGPGIANLPGYGDQRNYELFVEAGFSPEEAIQIMTSNGARLLERDDIGSIADGKLSNLVVLKGDLAEDPSVIRNVKFVLKKGVAYDPAKLITDVKGHTGSENDDLLTYMGQKKPGMKPDKFAPNQISKSDKHEFGSVFSEDGTEFYYGVDENGKAEIRFTKLENGVWTSPSPLITHERFSFNDPFLSPDENKLYYISDMPRDESAEPKDYDNWYSIRNDSGCSESIHGGDSINTDTNEYYISFTKDGSMYFASNSAAGEGRNMILTFIHPNLRMGFSRLLSGWEKT